MITGSFFSNRSSSFNRRGWPTFPQRSQAAAGLRFMFALYFTDPSRERLGALFVASVAHLKPARMLTLDDDFAMD
jgi:hypothetical protein